MDAFLQALRNMGAMRLAIMGGVVVGLVAFFAWLATRLAAPSLELLYGDLDLTDSSRIVAHLEAEGIPYEIAGGGGQVLVPADQVLRMRMALADQGLPSGGSVGYEIFDNPDSFGTTNFLQNVNLVRALEGELARTVRAIETVHSARVHLVLPRRELFSREEQQARASVVLQMRGGNRLSQAQVRAVQHLIASSVPALAPGDVSVVDERGALLAPGFNETDTDVQISAQADERRRRFETNLTRTIEELVGQIVGVGKVRAQVSAHIDFDRINTSEEIYDPDGQVVRSTRTLEETASSTEESADPVSVSTNLPDASFGTMDGGTGAQSAETRIEETVNYEVSKKIVNRIRETGVVNRLSVAVVVDGIYTPIDDPEITEYEPRTQEEMELLATVVRSAIGFDAERGDTVEVINIKFAHPEVVEEKLELFFGLGKNDLLRMAEILVLSIVAILVILLERVQGTRNRWEGDSQRA